MNDFFQHLFHIETGLGADFHGFAAVQPDQVFDFLFHHVGLGARQIDFIQYRQDFQVVVQGQIHVGQCLGLHALGRIHHQHRPVTGRQGTGHFISEVHVARGINEMEQIVMTVSGMVDELHGIELDGDAPLPLQVHGVQDLVFHFPFFHGVRQFQDAVGQGAFPMVDVGDD